MKKFALPLSVSIISLAVIGCDNVSLKDTAKTSAANNAVIMAKTPVHAKGMVAAANPYATQAGLEILNAGGSAIDAAIAVQTTLGLVEPQSSGLGGGAFLITYDSKTGEVWNYDGRETAPAAATRELFLSDEIIEGERKPLSHFKALASGRSTGGLMCRAAWPAPPREWVVLSSKIMTRRGLIFS